jgi:hypothetical protein
LRKEEKEEKRRRPTNASISAKLSDDFRTEFAAFQEEIFRRESVRNTVACP